jgi:transcriptional regulator with XRE-family HTH domain
VKSRAARKKPDDGLSDVFRRLLATLIRRAGSEQVVADRCGLSWQSINDWKNGKSLPRFAPAVKLADGMGVSLDWLLRGIGAESVTMSRGLEALQQDVAAFVVQEVSARTRIPATQLAANAERILGQYIDTVSGEILERLEQEVKGVRFRSAYADVATLVSELEDIAYTRTIAGLEQQVVDWRDAMAVMLDDLQAGHREARGPDPAVWFHDEEDHMHFVMGNLDHRSFFTRSVRVLLDELPASGRIG